MSLWKNYLWVGFLYLINGLVGLTVVGGVTYIAYFWLKAFGEIARSGAQ